MSNIRSRAPRGSLSADQIVRAACDLIASVGLDKFSMPELARRLEASVTSVYWYFRSKDELLRAIAERVTAEFYEGLDDDAGSSGDDRVLRQFRVYWRRLGENPLWREVFISGGFVHAVSGSPEGGRRAAAVVQRQVERMMDAGLSPHEAAEAYRILSAHTRGAVVVMHQDRAAITGEEAAVLGIQSAMSGPAAEGWADIRDDDTLFDAGLRALWSGLVAQARTRA